jgi:hypothetical protein
LVGLTLSNHGLRDDNGYTKVVNKYTIHIWSLLSTFFIVFVQPSFVFFLAICIINIPCKWETWDSVAYSLTMFSKHKDWHYFDVTTSDCSIILYHNIFANQEAWTSSTTLSTARVKKLRFANSYVCFLSYLLSKARFSDSSNIIKPWIWCPQGTSPAT